MIEACAVAQDDTAAQQSQRDRQFSMWSGGWRRLDETVKIQSCQFLRKCEERLGGGAGVWA